MISTIRFSELTQSFDASGDFFCPEHWDYHYGFVGSEADTFTFWSSIHQFEPRRHEEHDVAQSSLCFFVPLCLRGSKKTNKELHQFEPRRHEDNEVAQSSLCFFVPLCLSGSKKEIKGSAVNSPQFKLCNILKPVS